MKQVLIFCFWVVGLLSALSAHAQAAISLGAAPVVCAGATSASISYSVTAGSPVRYSIRWDSSATASGLRGAGDGHIVTVAGTHGGGYEWPREGLFGTSVNNSSSVAAIDTANQIFWSTTYNGNRIFRIDRSRILHSYAGVFSRTGYSGDGGQATAALLGTVSGMSVARDGNLYFSDVTNHIVRKIAPNGIISTIAGIPGNSGYSGDGTAATAARLNAPKGLTIDGAGNVYIQDNNNNVVRKVSVSGIISTVAGNGTSGYAGDGGAATAAELYFPADGCISADRAGNLFIASDYVVRKVSILGGITTVAGDGGYGTSGDGGPATAASLFAVSVAVDDLGNLFISGGYFGVIRKVDDNGVITTVVGTGTSGYSGDGGPATAAQVTNPQSMFSGYDNSLYFLDYYNSTVRKVSYPLSLTSSLVDFSLPKEVPVGSYKGYFTVYDSSGSEYTDSFTFTVAPLAGPVGGTPFVCTGNTTQLVVPYTGGTWSSSASSVATVGSAGLVYGVAAGSATISYQLSSACGSTHALKSVTVTEVPSITLGAMPVVVAGDTLAYQNFSGSTVGAKYRITWNDTAVAAGFAGTPSIITTIAGTGPFNGDGRPANAVALNAQRIVADTSGNLFIADGNQRKILKVTASGVISAYAGNGTSSYTNGIPATASGLSSTMYLAIDRRGALYVSGDNRVSRIDTLGVIHLVAGSGAGGYSGDGGAATAAGLNADDIAVDTSDNLYIADKNNNIVRKVSTAGIITTLAGVGVFRGDGGPASSAVFNNPQWLATDLVGSLFIRDQGNSKIRKINSTGVVSTVATSYAHTSRIACDVVGNVYFPEYGIVKKVSTTGVINIVAGIQYNSGFSGDGGAATAAKLGYTPGALAVDAAGNLYIADIDNNRIRKVSTSGVITTVAGNGSSGYTGTGDGGAATAATLGSIDNIAVDAAGVIYIGGSNKVRKVSTSGIITAVTDGGRIALDTAGNLYILSSYRVRKVTPSGISMIVAGTGSYGYTGDGGAATAAKINVSGMAVDVAGNIYLSDAGNNTIRKVSTSGVITTIAGVLSYSGDGGAATNAGIKVESIATDDLGNLYISGLYSDTTRIRKVAPTNVITTLPTGTQPINQRTLATDAAGNLLLDVSGTTIKKRSFSGTFSNVAGNGFYPTYLFSNGDGGQATAAPIGALGDVFVSRNGAVFFVNGGTIRKVATTGIITTVAGTLGAGEIAYSGLATASVLSSFGGLTVDVFGNIYSGGEFIQKIDGAGIMTKIGGIGAGPTILTHENPASTAAMYANGITIDEMGNLYFSSNINISKINIFGIASVVAGDGYFGYSGDGGPARDARFGGMGGLVKDKAGNMYIADGGNHVVRKVDVFGTITTIAGTGSAGFSGDGGAATAALLSWPSSLAISPSGELFVYEQNNQVVRKIDTLGFISTYAGIAGVSDFYGDGGPATAAALGPAYGSSVICLDPYGNLYFSETWGDRVRMISPAGIIHTVAGNPIYTGLRSGYSGDGGPATAAQLSTPQGVAIDINGDLLIVDGGNGVLRRVTYYKILPTSPLPVQVPTSADTGTYHGMLTLQNGTCNNTYPISVKIIGGVNGIARLCSGNTITLSNSTPGGTWSSSNSAIATIGTGGVVTGIAAGTSTISYAMVVSGTTYYAKKVLTVLAAPTISLGTMSTICLGDTVASIPYSATTGSPTYSLTWDSTAESVGFVGTPSIITTIAGDHSLGGTYSGDGGSATAAGLHNPFCVDIDGFGNVFIADGGNIVVRKIDTLGNISTIAGNGTLGYSGDGGAATAASFNYLFDIAVDASGNLYIADGANNVVRKVDTRGIITTVAGNEGAGGYTGDGGPATAASLRRPVAVAVDAYGALYICDAYNYVIRRVDVSGIITTVAGNGTVGYSGDGGAATLANITLNGVPNSKIACDANGNIYIGDMSRFVIRKVDVFGTITTVAGGGARLGVDNIPATDCALGFLDISCDEFGNIYIAEGTSVRKIDPTGIISTVVGRVGVAGIYSGDGGPPTSAGLSNVSGISIDASGSLYLSDYGHHVIRKVRNIYSLPTSPIPVSVPSTAAAGTYRGTVTVYNWLCSQSYPISVTIHAARPDSGAISGTSTVCVGTTSTLNDTATGGVWSSANTAVATVGSSTGLVHGVTAGTTTISYTVTNGCGSAVATTVVTVNATPPAPTISSSSSVCTGNTSTISTTGTGGSWSSSSANATVSSAGTVSGMSAGTATISYTVSNTCGSAAATYTITINPSPDAGALSGASSVCTGATITLSTTGSGGSWSSSSANATVGTSGIVSGVGAGTTTISYSVSNTCGSAAATFTVTINPSPNAGALSGASSVCTGTTITLSTTGTGGSWSSSSANATVGSAGIVSGVSAGTTTISYTVSNTCGSAAATHTLTINPAPNAGSISGTSSVVAGSTITLSSSGTTGGTWSSSNGNATVSVGVVGGVSAGTAIISYAVTNGCGTAAATKTITINVGTLSTISGPSTLCVGASGTYSHATSGGVWASSNSSRAVVGSSSGIVSGVSVGTAAISYTVGGVTVTTTLTVLPSPAVINGTSVVCVGAITTLSTTSTGGSWVSNDPAIATASTTAYGIVGGVSGGTTTISYLFSSGCASTRTFTVSSSPSAILGANTLCYTQSDTISNTTLGGTWATSHPTIATVIPIGDGIAIVRAFSTSSNPTITYTMPGGCRATVLVPVVNMSTTISGTASVCAGLTTVFAHSAAGGVWSSSDAAIATTGTGSGTVYGVSAGTATISYTANAACGQAKTVTVLPAPAAIMGAGGLCVGQTLTLSNAVSGGVWAKGTWSAVSVGSASGIVTGVAAGSALLSYTIGTCRVTASVTVSAIPSNITGATTICAGNATTLGSTPTGGTWSSSNLSVATNSSAVVRGVSGGTSVISYSLGSGCYKTATVSVSNLPGSILGASNLCLSQVITLSNATPGGWWNLSGSTAASIGTATGIVTASGSITGSPLIKYIMPGNCSTSVTISVVNLASIGGGAGSICEGKTTLFTNATAGGFWTSASPSVATMGTGSGLVTGVSAGSSVISYALNASCARTTTVTVRTAPGVTTGPASVCAGLTITLSNPVSGGAWSTVSSIATVGTSSGIVGGVTASSVRAIITYTMPGGCFDTMGVLVVTLSGITGVSSVCEGQTITLYNTAPGGTWSSSNTSVASVNAASGQVFGAAAGTATISYTIGSGCTVSKSVTVNTFAQITGPTEVCAGITITLSNPLSGGTWSSRYITLATVDASSGVVTGVAGGGTMNTITYTLPGGCNDTSLLWVHYRAPITGADTVCEGATVHLSNARAMDAGTWSSSNTAVATITPSTADVWGVASGTTTISYLLPTGCVSTFGMTVNPAPAAITGPSVVCVGTAITLSSASAGGLWSRYYSTASIGSTSGVVTGISGGSVANIITYTLPTGCRDTALIIVDACARPETSTAGEGTATLRVTPNPNAGTFTISGQLATTDDEQLTIEVTNMLGQVVYTGNTLATEGTINAQVQLGKNIANGMYLLAVKSPREVRVFHIVVEQ